ncbi:partner of Y14 and mago isoform X1 [Amblyraja radiata]|uniref:partner of Y14 and mago isoform X1 n=1 Tax=Amblyraja radiata TaxID=386614 RepID=UPI0014022764|nr:partner of Y14 and mago isoform X1 [Amblyraja radiata]
MGEETSGATSGALIMAAPYVTDETGKYIPASQRPDGTWRKPRRVREGYVPPEEVPVYENKFVKFFKSKPDLPPGLNADESDKSKQQQSKQDGELVGLSKSAKRNLKRKEKRKQQQECDGTAEADELSQTLQKTTIAGGSGNRNPSPLEAAASLQGDHEGAEKAKKVKNLKKKLRQIDELQQKLDSGEIKQATKEQLEKLSRREQLMEELEDLELGL